MKKGTLKSRGGTTTVHFTADTENVQLLVLLSLSCNQLVLFLSVAQIHDDQPELSSAVTERELNVSETEISRRPPLSPLADNAAADPALGDKRHDRM